MLDVFFVHIILGLSCQLLSFFLLKKELIQKTNYNAASLFYIICFLCGCFIIPAIFIGAWYIDYTGLEGHYLPLFCYLVTWIGVVLNVGLTLIYLCKNYRRNYLNN